jgi:L-arabinonolactonase
MLSNKFQMMYDMLRRIVTNASIRLPDDFDRDGPEDGRKCMRIDCVLEPCSIVGEGPFWDVGQRCLWWVDIPAGKVHRFDPALGENRSRDFGEVAGCLAATADGKLVVAGRNGIFRFDFETGEKTLIVDPEPDLPKNRFNDGATDCKGRFWAGTMREGGGPVPEGTIYRLDPDGTCTAFFSEIFTPNGLAFSADGKRMYFSDSNPAVRTIWVCDYDSETGTPSNRRVFFDTRAVEGRPDGGTVDAEGCFWMAGVGGWQLVRYTPDGAIDRIIDMPAERPTKIMFGGPDLDTLYVTSFGIEKTLGTEDRQPCAGGLFAITGLGVRGVAQTPFAG